MENRNKKFRVETKRHIINNRIYVKRNITNRAYSRYGRIKQSRKRCLMLKLRKLFKTKTETFWDKHRIYATPKDTLRYNEKIQNNGEI